MKTIKTGNGEGPLICFKEGLSKKNINKTKYTQFTEICFQSSEKDRSTQFFATKTMVTKRGP